MAILVRVDGTEEDFDYVNATLEQLQAAVGGLIEYVNLPNGNAIICNEEGKLKNLPSNEKASYAMHREWWIIGKQCFDWIAGDVIFVSKVELAAKEGE